MKSLEKRVQKLEDLEAIKALKYEYARRCDDAINKQDPLPFVEVFTEDAVWDVGAFGKYVGRDGIKDGALPVLTQQIKFTYHFFSHPQLELDGDRAKGTWYLWALYTMADGKDYVLAGMEKETYSKVDGEWLISSCELDAGVFAPHLEGWVKQIMGDETALR